MEQVVIVRYLIGLGDDYAGLRYRLLPPSGFINMGMYEQRVREGYNTSGEVAVHCGFLNKVHLAYRCVCQHLCPQKS